jgi:hypothetical protein
MCIKIIKTLRGINVKPRHKMLMIIAKLLLNNTI